MSEFQTWPSWRYGPNGASKLCENEAEVPKGGWIIRKLPKSSPRRPQRLPRKLKPSLPVKETKADVDAAGVAFDPALHATSRSFTSKGSGA